MGPQEVREPGSDLYQRPQRYSHRCGVHDQGFEVRPFPTIRLKRVVLSVVVSTNTTLITHHHIRTMMVADTLGDLSDSDRRHRSITRMLCL